jgi:hypothetical protein
MNGREVKIMKGIAISVVIAMILAILAIAIIASIFLLGVQLSPLEAHKIFSHGCIAYCKQINDQSQSTGERIELTAMRFANNISDSLFIRACYFLYPDTAGYPYLCWNRDCCQFNLPLP